MRCLNCGHSFEGAFCPQCGQRADTKRITWKGLLHQLLTGITHINRGFLFTFKELTIAPGRTIHQYLEGKRVNIYNPFAYAILSVTILILIDLNVKASIDLPELTTAFDDSQHYDAGYNYGRFIRQNLKLTWLLNILYYSIIAKSLFSKNNFAEHLVINAYVIGHSALLMSVVMLFFNWTFTANPIMYLIIILMIVLVHKRKYPLSSVIIFSLINVFLGICLFLFFPFPFYWLFSQF